MDDWRGCLKQGETRMRYDRPARHPAIVVETPIGIVYELDVWLSAEEVAVITAGQLMPSSRRIYEPWLRITCGVDDTVEYRIEIVEQDDGA